MNNHSPAQAHVSDFWNIPPIINSSSNISPIFLHQEFIPQPGAKLTSTPPLQGLGYFAFPPSANASGNTHSFNQPTHVQEQDAEDEREREENEELLRSKERDRVWAERLERDAGLCRIRLEREAVEARHGEEEWVRSGGVLRDKEGRRDKVRTEAVRAELKLREEEEELVRVWEGYEGRWAGLVRRGEEREVRWGDIPWPVYVGKGKEVRVGDLSVGKVEEFLLGGLRVRGCGVTRKERVRSSLLRWHPDKMTGVLGRVVKEDVEAVVEGISVVMMCLTRLQQTAGEC